MTQQTQNVQIQIVPDQYTKAPDSKELDSYININNLSLDISNERIFEDISLPIYKNHINALIGPSGCGKSSLLNCVTRLSDHISNYNIQGSIEADNTSIFDKKTDLIQLRKNIGMIFQKPMPFPMSIKRNFEIPLKEHGINDKTEINDKIENALQRVGLWQEVKDRLNKDAQQLSGGQQQRLCIARALALEPKALLLDEPCSALDPIATRVIEELLLELKESYTILIVTHNLAQAKRIADYVAFMWYADKHGKLIEHNTADVIFNSASNPLTNAYVQGITE